MSDRKQDALRYHEEGRPGKIQVVPTKPTENQRDLSLAYTPGVAEPCLAIAERPEDAYKYTARGNLVAVVSNGTAVLGLGDIGPLAGKPVMEGKGVLFKTFADIDVFDLEINAPTPDDVIRFCQALEPTVGGINLEDIKSPDCFHIEERLRETMAIPVFHDDQHGTAIISGAALLNGLEVVGKQLADVRCVFLGAGAAAIATAEHYVRLGVRREHITLVDHRRRGGHRPCRSRPVQATLRARTLVPHPRGGARGRRRLRRAERRARPAGRGTGRDGARPARSSPWPTPTPRSPPRRSGPSGPTRSSPRAAPTTRTRSTTSSASRSSSGARSTCERAPSTKR